VRNRFWTIAAWTPAVLLTAILLGWLAAIWTGGIAAVFAWYVGQLALPALSILTLAGTVAYSAWTRRMNRVVMVTSALGFIATLPALLVLGYVDVPYPASIEATRPWATVRLPTDQPVLVGWGGDTIAVNYHVVAPDQRWAYDLLIEPFPDRSSRLEDYGCWNTPVVSPAAGEVVVAHDGERDEVPGRKSGNYLNPSGNYVALRLETGTHLLIAHMRQGTVAVRRGERVHEGQLLGRCGNSGNTSGPHIHIHHQRQDPAVFPAGFAEGLPLFFRDHDGPPMPIGGVKKINGRTVWSGQRIRHIGNGSK
jgi:hypothetical protein